MLQELVAKFPKPANLLGLTAPQIDAALLACIAGRAEDPNPIAAKFTLLRAESLALQGRVKARPV
jgi:hypothetical protein